MMKTNEHEEDDLMPFRGEMRYEEFEISTVFSSTKEKRNFTFDTHVDTA